MLSIDDQFPLMMDKYELFKSSVRDAAERFSKLDKNQPVKVISHLDADGISAVSIMLKALDRLNMRYSVSIVQQLNEEVISRISEEEGSIYMFTDLGSGSLNDIKRVLGKKQIFVLDHHDIDPDYSKEQETGMVFVNPHLFGIDGGNEISGSGVVYLFAKAIDPANEEMARIAVVGSIGDVQENRGFMRLNDEILQDAVNNGSIKVKEGLKVFGYQTRPIHKVLEYSSDPYIPGVTGSESRAIQFLNSIGIDPQKGKDWKRMKDLTDEEMKKLIAAVIMKRINEDNPEDVIGFYYQLQNEKEGTPLRDAKEFATLLNACGRLDKASLGIGACMGEEEMKRKALRHQQEYKKEIVKTMRWFRESNQNDMITKGKGYVIIDAGDQIIPSMIGTLASMLTKSNEFEDGTLVMGLARDTEKGSTKVSLRVAGRNNNIDLNEIMRSITEKAGGEAGGHMQAAGAVIKTSDEEIFVETAKAVFENNKNLTNIL